MQQSDETGSMRSTKAAVPKGQAPDTPSTVNQGEAEILREAFLAGARAMREAASLACLEQQAVFGSNEYATGQPASSFGERFACGMCITVIDGIDANALHLTAQGGEG